MANIYNVMILDETEMKTIKARLNDITLDLKHIEEGYYKSEVIRKLEDIAEIFKDVKGPQWKARPDVWP